MNADALREVARLVDRARELHRLADDLWTARPVAALEPVRVLRNELEHRIADLEGIEL